MHACYGCIDVDHIKMSFYRSLNKLLYPLDFVWSGLCFFVYGNRWACLVVCVSLKLVTCVFI